MCTQGTCGTGCPGLTLHTGPSTLMSGPKGAAGPDPPKAVPGLGWISPLTAQDGSHWWQGTWELDIRVCPRTSAHPLSPTHGHTDPPEVQPRQGDPIRAAGRPTGPGCEQPHCHLPPFSLGDTAGTPQERVRWAAMGRALPARETEAWRAGLAPVTGQRGQDHPGQC